MNNIKTYSGLKKIILISVLSLAFIKVEIVKRPIIGFSTNNIQLESIPINQYKDFSFKIFNWGNEKLIVDTIVANCNCMSFEYLKTPIDQEDSILVRAAYQSTSFGKIKKSIIVISNSNSRFKVINLTGQVDRSE